MPTGRARGRPLVDEEAQHPEYVEDDLIEKLTEFIETTLAEKLASQETQCLEDYLKQDGGSKSTVDAWAELYKREHAEFAQCGNER